MNDQDTHDQDAQETWGRVPSKQEAHPGRRTGDMSDQDAQKQKDMSDERCYEGTSVAKAVSNGILARYNNPRKRVKAFNRKVVPVDSHPYGRV